MIQVVDSNKEKLNLIKFQYYYNKNKNQTISGNSLLAIVVKITVFEPKTPAAALALVVVVLDKVLGLASVISLIPDRKLPVGEGLRPIIQTKCFNFNIKK